MVLMVLMLMVMLMVAGWRGYTLAERLNHAVIIAQTLAQLHEEGIVHCLAHFKDARFGAGEGAVLLMLAKAMPTSTPDSPVAAILQRGPDPQVVQQQDIYQLGLLTAYLCLLPDAERMTIEADGLVGRCNSWLGSCPDALLDVIQSCTIAEAAYRPDAATVAAALDEIIMKLQGDLDSHPSYV
ncbi:uncharacterized protein MONBRDRAFT_22362 [Monosiga brevicollis MX1]|uniref:Protein kinase domain-containing protein n=1 Tax=Monosiga brevicollis TaxID=81824 RepID=A9UQC9_MONBE|nr:uncharacterized protein MONBRDRAFT_22362 [Monosiga brevicollis MX1]EDQ92576.1 predicted protein [Monosiga brevicollis MX1]|eukprot:XP_001742338.1 hypothetical protein [Monosiga brevicollis MX1]